MRPLIYLLVAGILSREDSRGSRFWLMLIALAAGTAIVVAICSDIVAAWIKRVSGRSWPTVTAVVDIVSVARIGNDSLMPSLKSSLDQTYYLATLTYIYRHPEEQMGEYSRSFGKREDAEAWANSYKNETVKVHVDPRDPTRSVLREEDL